MAYRQGQGVDLRFHRHRRGGPHRHGNDQGTRTPEAAACAVQGVWPCDYRHDRRADRHVLRHRVAAGAAGAARPIARACVDRQPAQSDLAGRAHVQGAWHRYDHDAMVWPGGAGRHAA
ncbi:hypothetical protein G6F35_017548 [Rhizopus arrhizus]|nr:hypothetical protein G6F35_017548 [Rhizopus arrhizus]